MGLGSLSGVSRSNHAKYGVHAELVKKRWVYANKERTLNTAITV